MAHAFVGNTCPGVYQINDSKFVIGTATERKRPVKGAKRVAGICTDLWWFSIVDYDQFVSRSGREPGEYEEVVSVKPGVYRFRHRYHQVDDDDYRNPQIYTYIDRVRKPDPVVDFQAEWMKLNFTVGQIIWGKLNGKYKDLYIAEGKQPDMDSIMRAADQILCVGGGGGDYHPNGWIGYDPDLKSDCPDIEIPIFTKKYRWYPWSNSGRIPVYAGVGKDLFASDKKPQPHIHINQSFLALACNICQCIVRYGCESYSRSSNKDAKIAQREEAATRKLALKSLKGFAKKYPDQFPDYCRDLLKEKA
jgi:hypothetical protein